MLNDVYHPPRRSAARLYALSLKHIGKMDNSGYGSTSKTEIIEALVTFVPGKDYCSPTIYSFSAIFGGSTSGGLHKGCPTFYSTESNRRSTIKYQVQQILSIYEEIEEDAALISNFCIH